MNLILLIMLILLISISIIIIIPEQYIENFTLNNKVAIVSTVRNPHQINDWLQYHYNFGISKIYLIFDNPNESFKNNFGNKLQFFFSDSDWYHKLKNCRQYESLKSTINIEVMTRQILNIEHILKLCINDGIDWLIHIDGDEILYSEKFNTISEVISNLKKDTNIIKINNFELAPIEDDAYNCFRTHMFFKTRKNGKNFVAYYNGKSGCKVSDDVYPYGVHEFKKYQGEKKELMSDMELIVLHYVNCNFYEWKNKYKILGNFKNKWWDNVSIPFHLHKKSRDVINTIKDDNHLKKIYNNEMLISEYKLKESIKQGSITKIDKVKNYLCGKNQFKSIY